MEKKEDIKQDGINVTNVTFDANGEVAGLEDVALDEAALDEVDGAGNGNCGICFKSAV